MNKTFCYTLKGEDGASRQREFRNILKEIMTNGEDEVELKLRQTNFKMMKGDWRENPPSEDEIKDIIFKNDNWATSYIYYPIKKSTFTGDIKLLLLKKKKEGQNVLGISFTKYSYMTAHEHDRDDFKMTYGLDFIFVEGK